MSVTPKDSPACKPILQPEEREVDQGTDQNAGLQLCQTSRWMKLAPLCILFPTGVSLTILTLHLRHYKDDGLLYRWSASNRVLVQVVIHILSSILGVLWTYPICTVISHWTRYRLSKRSVNLDTLRVWSAVTQARADWNLPWGYMIATLVFLATSYVPAALWAGALTPAFTHSVVTNISLAGEAICDAY
jgi:hypothetical protein